jgi:hypothetical protein
MQTEAVLFLSNKWDGHTTERFEHLRQAENRRRTVIYLYHAQEGAVPQAVQRRQHFTFSNAVLHELGYTPLENSLLPGSNHFPLLKFYLENPRCDYYWLVEDDVCFTGDWRVFFDAFQRCQSDFASSYIEKYEEDPYWYWWWSLRSPAPLGKYDRVCSFNPVYRLSHKALQCLDNALKSGWSGHHEVTIPTILYNNGLSMMDMGWTGSFTPRRFKNRFYIPESMWYEPVVLGDRENTLYHPVKQRE